MTDAGYFAAKAARCRELVGRAVTPEVAEQLRLWADEFQVMADAFSVGSLVGQRHEAAPGADRRSSDERDAPAPDIRHEGKPRVD